MWSPKDFRGWKTNPLVESEMLSALRHLRKHCGFIRLSKFTLMLMFSLNLIDCGNAHDMFLTYLLKCVIVAKRTSTKCLYKELC